MAYYKKLKTNTPAFNRYGGGTPRRPNPSPLASFGSPVPSSCPPTPGPSSKEAVCSSKYKKKDYQVNKDDGDYSYFYDQFKASLEHVKEQEKNTPTKLIR